MNKIDHDPSNGSLYLDIRENTGHLKSYVLDINSFLFKNEFNSLRVLGTSEIARTTEPLSFIFFLKEEKPQELMVWFEKGGEAFTYRVVSEFTEKEKGTVVLQYIIENNTSRSSENFLFDSSSLLKQEDEKFQFLMKQVTSQIKGTLTHIIDGPPVLLLI